MYVAAKTHGFGVQTVPTPMCEAYTQKRQTSSDSAKFVGYQMTNQCPGNQYSGNDAASHNKVQLIIQVSVVAIEIIQVVDESSSR